ncbi:Amiloride-sensitive sodium channel [Teladorsagia circumcincta]|uniref:Amiloride-sensitive sodium channel n=1 Tax=Teladorsagia circumcincta TaxID=45464 RepID=A0A2G9V285_TELCI|nr:Amiloride-sensitive sodium channel [Teladorsagia circumcincta]
MQTADLRSAERSSAMSSDDICGSRMANSVCVCEDDECEADAPKAIWQNTTCQFCDDHMFCQKYSKNGERQNEPCLCGNGEAFCMKYDRMAKLLNLWEFFGELSKVTDITDDQIEALGFGNMTDEVAIVTKAKENIIFAMSAVSEQQRDFAIISDPTFGNCFTFNHNRSDIKSSLRAGPMHGLRVMLFVNASDYLPTSEAVGVRLTIHDKDEFPFPDTFGYSAPTGYISSFGMRMKKMSRLPAPYGDCIAEGATSNYIYEGYAYSTEGCYRTCFQQLIIDRCGCGDPRFPSIGDHKLCEVFNKEHSRFSGACKRPLVCFTAFRPLRGASVVLIVILKISPFRSLS